MFSQHFVNHPFNAASCGLNSEESPVQGGLAMTPAQMFALAAQGTPVTPQNLGNVYTDGSNKVTFDVPIDQRRGIDVGDIWEAAQKSKGKIKDYVKGAKPQKTE